MPVAEDIAIMFDESVVPINVLLPLGPVFITQVMTVGESFGDGTLLSIRDDGKWRLIHKFGHVCVECLPEIDYTDAKLVDFPNIS